MDPVLEAEYSLRPRHPEREAEYAAMRADGLALRAAHAATLDLPYEEGPRARIDLFLGAPGAPLAVFLHGGYWRALDKETFSFLAVPLLAAGFSVALPGYALAPAAGVAAIGAQVRRALGWLGRCGLGFDPGRVVLSGHSAGAQLAAEALRRGVPGLGLRGLVGVSGIYDLLPLCRTSIGASIGLGEAEARACSPMADPPRAPACLLVGGAETDGFIGQSRRFAAALGQPGALRVEPGLTHFTVLRACFGPEVLEAMRGWVGQGAAIDGTPLACCPGHR